MSLTPRSFGTRCRNEIWAVIWDRHAQHEDADDVEQYDADERLVHGARDVAAWIGGLAKSNADELCPDVGKRCLHKRIPDAEEAAEGSGLKIFGKGAGVLPIPEPRSMMVRAAAQSDNET